MFYRPAAHLALPLRARLGAFFSFLAVLAALLAPLSLLAEEVRTGKLGGICSAGRALPDPPDDGQPPPAGAHCSWCISVGLALPPLPPSIIPCFPGLEVADLAFPADRVASVTGLPFSRAPPAVG